MYQSKLILVALISATASSVPLLKPPGPIILEDEGIPTRIAEGALANANERITTHALIRLKNSLHNINRDASGISPHLTNAETSLPATMNTLVPTAVTGSQPTTSPYLAGSLTHLRDIIAPGIALTAPPPTEHTNEARFFPKKQTFYDWKLAHKGELARETVGPRIPHVAEYKNDRRSDNPHRSESKPLYTLRPSRPLVGKPLRPRPESSGKADPDKPGLNREHVARRAASVSPTYPPFEPTGRIPKPPFKPRAPWPRLPSASDQSYGCTIEECCAYVSFKHCPENCHIKQLELFNRLPDPEINQAAWQ